MLVWDDSMRNKWPMAKVVMTYPHKKGPVCSVQFQLGKSSGKEGTIFERPINKLVLLLENKQH